MLLSPGSTERPQLNVCLRCWTTTRALPARRTRSDYRAVLSWVVRRCARSRALRQSVRAANGKLRLSRARSVRWSGRTGKGLRPFKPARGSASGLRLRVRLWEGRCPFNPRLRLCLRICQRGSPLWKPIIRNIASRCRGRVNAESVFVIQREREATKILCGRPKERPYDRKRVRRSVGDGLCASRRADRMTGADGDKRNPLCHSEERSDEESYAASKGTPLR